MLLKRYRGYVYAALCLLGHFVMAADNIPIYPLYGVPYTTLFEQRDLIPDCTHVLHAYVENPRLMTNPSDAQAVENLEKCLPRLAAMEPSERQAVLTAAMQLQRDNNEYFATTERNPESPIVPSKTVNEIVAEMLPLTDAANALVVYYYDDGRLKQSMLYYSWDGVQVDQSRLDEISSRLQDFYLAIYDLHSAYSAALLSYFAAVALPGYNTVVSMLKRFQNLQRWRTPTKEELASGQFVTWPGLELNKVAPIVWTPSRGL